MARCDAREASAGSVPISTDSQLHVSVFNFGGVFDGGA